MTNHPGPWVPVCADCWYTVAPDLYLPDNDSLYDGKTCVVCGDDSLPSGHLRKSEVDAWKNDMRAKYGDADDKLRSYAN